MQWPALAALVAILVGACEALHPDMLVWTAALLTMKEECAMSQRVLHIVLLSHARSCTGMLYRNLAKAPIIASPRHDRFRVRKPIPFSQPSRPAQQ